MGSSSTLVNTATAAPLDVFRRDVLQGLGSHPKSLPCKYFYDRKGCQLFDRICQLDEYYLTRTETWIMERYAAEMAAAMGPEALLIELGSGSSTKTRLLLDQQPQPAAYLPVDIAGDHLDRSARRIARDYRRIKVMPCCADFTRPFVLPADMTTKGRRIVYFPGSTIGNFLPPTALQLLEHIHHLARPGGGLLIGIDLVKPVDVLEAAYNDRQGVTAQFNLNLLHRINRQLEGSFQVDHFSHRAWWNPAEERMEIYVESRIDQVVQVGRQSFRLRAGELIHTENSHKYRIPTFSRMAAEVGFALEAVWTDPQRWFAVLLFGR